MEELSVECTSMSLRLTSRLYATIGGCGKMSRVCWSVDKMLTVKNTSAVYYLRPIFMAKQTL